MKLGSFFNRKREERSVAPAPPPTPLMQKSAGRSHVGRVRTVNEDRMLELPDRGMWAVADGMGGHSSGDVAATIVIEELSAAALSGANIEDDEVIAALHNANRNITARCGRAEATSGTTVVVARIRGSVATIWWVGDSRAYRIRGGRPLCLTRDHSLVQELVDAGALSEGQAERHPQRNVITRAVGVGDDLQIDVVEAALEPGDLLLLCSDGISRSMAFDDFLSPYTRVDELADTILRNALDRDGTDNATVVVIQNTREYAPDQLKCTIQ